MSPVDRDEETLVTCPRCNGDGFLVVQADEMQIRGVECDVCEGVGGLTLLEMRAWNAARAIERMQKGEP